MLCTYIGLISIARKEGIFALKQGLNVLQAPNLELFRVFVNHLPLEGMNEGVRIEEDWSLRQINLALPHRLKVLVGHARLANSPGREVHDVVTVGANF